jgi:hypothetical protein
MAIEIRELLIKVRIEEGVKSQSINQTELAEMRQSILRECKKEIKKELSKSKDR